jgi:hypothetical protein
MRFPLRAVAAAGVFALIGSTAGLAADTTQSAQASTDNQQLVEMVRDLQVRLDKDEMALRSMQNQLPKTQSSSHMFCSDGYDPGRDACN